MPSGKFHTVLLHRPNRRCQYVPQRAGLPAVSTVTGSSAADLRCLRLSAARRGAVWWFEVVGRPGTNTVRHHVMMRWKRRNVLAVFFDPDVLEWRGRDDIRCIWLYILRQQHDTLFSEIVFLKNIYLLMYCTVVNMVSVKDDRLVYYLLDLRV